MKNIWKDSRTASQWLQLYLQCQRAHPGGFFAAEFLAWFVKTGQALDGKPVQSSDSIQMRAFDSAIDTSTRLFKLGGLVSIAEEIPDRLYPNAAFRLLPEPVVSLTRRGNSVARWKPIFQRIYLASVLTVAKALRTLAKHKVLLTVFSFTVSVLKLIFQWDTIVAGVTAAVAAALAAASVAFSSSK